MAISLLCLFFLCGRLPAQTVYGPGGLFIHPTTFMPERGDIDLNVSYFTQQIPPLRETEWLPVSLTYGLAGRAELGALYVHRRAGARQGDSGGAFAKYQILADSSHTPAFALAGSWISGDVKLASVSGVASHLFRSRGQPVLTVHAGVQWARRADIVTPEEDTGVFAGLEAPFSRQLSLVGEIGTRFRFDHSQTSAIGCMWTPSRQVRIGVSYINVGRSSENRFMVGVGYRLGGSH